MAKARVRRRGGHRGRPQCRQHQRRQGIGKRELIIGAILLYGVLAVTNMAGLWGSSRNQWAWYVLPVLVILNWLRRRVRVRLPRFRRVNLDLRHVPKRTVVIAGITAYGLLCLSYFKLGWGPDWLWIFWFVLPGLLGLVLLVRKYPGLAGGLLGRLREMSGKRVARAILLLALPVATLVCYTSESVWGMVDACVLLAIWAFCIYYWWPVNSWHGPQGAWWHVVRLPLLGLMAVSWWLFAGGSVTSVLGLIALELFALWAWAKPSPFTGAWPAVGSTQIVDLPIPRIMGYVRFLPYVFLALVVGLGVPMLGWLFELPLLLVVLLEMVNLGILAIVYLRWINKYPCSKMTYMTARVNFGRKIIEVNTGAAGGGEDVPFSAMQTLGKVDTGPFLDLVLFLLRAQVYKLRTLGGGSQGVTIVWAGARWLKAGTTGQYVYGRDAAKNGLMALATWGNGSQRH